jgi:hypothetical protein
MSNCTRYLGLDVHAESITAAIAEGRGRIRSIGKFPNRPEAVRKLIEKLGGGRNLRVCYEAGPTGYALYWQLTKLGTAEAARKGESSLRRYAVSTRSAESEAAPDA